MLPFTTLLKLLSFLGSVYVQGYKVMIYNKHNTAKASEHKKRASLRCADAFHNLQRGIASRACRTGTHPPWVPRGAWEVRGEGMVNGSPQPHSSGWHFSGKLSLCWLTLPLKRFDKSKMLWNLVLSFLHSISVLLLGQAEVKQTIGISIFSI